MSILDRLSNLFTKEVDAYVFDEIVNGVTIYIPCYNMYGHYNSARKEFLPYRLDEVFDENNKDYNNVRKIKISTSFCNYLCDWYELCTENQKWSTQNKQYFDDITK
jgi:hypothetical protein